MDTHKTKEDIKKKIDVLFGKIEELQARGNELTEDVKDEYHKQLAELKEEKLKLEEQYETFKASSEAKKHEVEIKSKSAWSDFKKGFKKLFSIFK